MSRDDRMNNQRRRQQGNHNNSSGGNNNQRRRGGGGGGGNSGGNRQRKNYPAMREKYLNQARDAIAMGDRVLAESYYQHADHCFRMIAEENEERQKRFESRNEHRNESRNDYRNQRRQGYENTQETSEESEDLEFDSENEAEIDEADMNVHSLPAFLTGSYKARKGENPRPPAQDWEE